MAGGTTGWDLYSTLVQQSEYASYYKSIPPVACPHDGTPLKPGPPQHPGVLFCPMGDFRYPDDYDAETMAGY
jgi:hypothetical protein